MPRDPGFARLVEALEPAGRLLSIRRLKGGLGATMHVLDIEMAGGGKRKVTLRRLIAGYTNGTPEGARLDFARLALVEKAGIPAPRPLLLDAEGEYLGVPTLVLSFIPGNSRHQPLKRDRWVGELAAAAAQIHAVKPDRFDLSFLPVFDEALLERRLDREAARVKEGDELAREALAVLREGAVRIEWLPRCLVHDDFWPGNTIWHRGHLVAVIDWGESLLGDRRMDVALCQTELAFTIDLVTADAFVAVYEGVAGPLPGLSYFSLLLALTAHIYIDNWLVGYRDVGMKLDPVEVKQKIDTFLCRALAEVRKS